MMECVPAVSWLVVTEPEKSPSPIGNGPRRGVPSMKVSVPVGPRLPEVGYMSIAEKVTELPNTEGFLELVEATVVAVRLTVCEPLAVEPVKLTLPDHTAVRASVPTGSERAGVTAVAEPLTRFTVKVAASRAGVAV